MELSRERKRTNTLRRILPLYDFIQLTVEKLGDVAICSVPLSAENTNHVGIMHAGVIFSLGEATAATAVSLHKPFSRLAVIAKSVEINYLKPASSSVHAIASLSDEQAISIEANRVENPKYAFEVEVALYNTQEKIVAEGKCVFVLRGT